MKTLEQVKNYLSTEGIKESEIGMVIGFLYAEGDYDMATPLEYENTKKTFGDFLNWYENEDEEVDDKEMDGGVFNDEVTEDDVIQYGNNLIGYWALMEDVVKKAQEATRNDDIDVDKNIDAAIKCSALMSAIADNILGLQMSLEILDTKKNKENEE